ncbi:hypothetical protein ACFXP7_06200 [Microbacterium sp. P06]|uniref:hypothetical protein n=1 Tax=unclassified Microbacterium TaxID=2609290 RepID=UPI003744BB49
MKGKVGLIIGLSAGYVLGTRAGRERYEQIKTQATKVWELEPVQTQVTKVQAFGASALKAVPSALFSGAKRVTGAASESGTVQERAKRAGAAAKSSAKDVADAVEESVDDAKKAASPTTSSTSKTNSPSSSSGS